MAKEWTIRACGADKSAMKHLVSRFPSAFRPDPASEVTANAPELKREGESWAMGQMEEVEARPGTRGMPGQWVLEEQSGRPRFVGQPEGGMRDTGAGYFLLMKGKANDEFVAVPVSEMFTFKPALQRRNQTLEEAEAAMQAQRLQHERANPRLAKAVARDDDDPLAILRDDQEDADSDEEWKGIKERAAARHVVKTAPQQQQQQQQQQRQKAGTRGAAEEQPEEDAAEKSDKGEDWEHEDVAADDDLDMGESEEEEAAGSPVRRGAGSDSEEEAGGAAGAKAKPAALQPDKAKKRLKRIMKETGLEDSSEDELSEGGEGDEESESIMDEEDLDRMAGPAGAAGAAGAAGGAGKAREPTPETQLRAAGEPAGGGKKRKASTPPTAAAGGQPAGAGAAGGEQGGAKRPRAGAGAPAGAAAAAGAAGAGGAPGAGAVAAAARPGVAAPAAPGTVTAEELKQLLRSKGRILLADLTAMYKPRLSPEGQRQFVQLVKQVAKMEQGSKYLVLKE